MNKIKNIISLILLLTSQFVLAQGWHNTYPTSQNPLSAPALEFGIEVKQTQDGGYAMLGEIDLATGAVRHYLQLLKTDANGQEQWRQTYDYGDVKLDEAASLLQMADGGFLLAGTTTYSTGSNLGQMLLIRTNSVGDTTWTKQFGDSGNNKGNELISTNDGGYMFAGGSDIYNKDAIYLVKLDAQADTLWTKYITASSHLIAYDIRQTTDGGYIITGSYNDQGLLIKLDAQGNTTWLKVLNISSGDFMYSVRETPNGEYVIAGRGNGFVGPFPVLVKTDATGNIIWTQSPPEIPSWGTQVELTADGNYMITGGLPFFSGSSVGSFTKIDTAGNILWHNNISTTNPVQFFSVENTTDGGYILGGQREGLFYLQKVDSLGNSYSNLIEGSVYNDTNFDCLPTLGEDSLQNWLIKTTGISGIQYTNVQADGRYNLLIGQGSHQVEVITTGSYWQPCNGIQIANFAGTYDSTTLDFGVQPFIQCPQLEVSLSTPFLRRCFDNNYIVSYQNNGTEDALNSYVEIEFDSFLLVNSSSIPWSAVNGNTYTFQLGTVPVNQGGSFSVNVYVDCNAVLGQTHCSQAHIYPDSICSLPPSWDKVDVELEATCLTDSIRFEIKNKGLGNMNAPLQYYVIEDDLIMKSGTFQLNANGNKMISVPTTGATYRLEAEQSTTHPEQPLEQPSIHIEGCTVNSSFSLGFVTIYPQNDRMPYTDIDCQENIGAFDPNDKTGYPLGYGTSNFIKKNQSLEYHIRFQNTGTDTAFNVVIKDIIDTTFLDIATLKTGASSHPYRLDIYDGNLLQFTFDNIQLPDSNINEPNSHGFIRFNIDQKLDNPNGTMIQNTADIFFDFNEAVTTNTTLHTVGENFITVETAPQFKDYVSVKVFPNPFHQSAQFEVEGIHNSMDFKVIDAQGRVVRQQTVSNQFQFERATLPSGIYFFTLQQEGVLIHSGKISIF